MPVVLELAPDRKVKATIGDLSHNGFRLKSDSLLHVGQSMKMLMPRETVSCELRWVDGHDAGGVFHEEARPPAW